MTVESVDYFANHQSKLRFPWSLYHRPIVRELDAALDRAEGDRVLNVGSGPFFELRELAARRKRFTICDVDPRAVELARTLYGENLVGADVVAAGAPLPYPDESFDMVVSMDVVEHVREPLPWVTDTLRVLRPGGVLFLTTPNYASASLRLIENTVLEAIARTRGFSRRDLHPTKLDSHKLTRLMESAGGRDTSVTSISQGWVLVGRARR